MAEKSAYQKGVEALDEWQEKYGDYIPVREVATFVHFSPQKFVDLLNEGYDFVTTKEEDFRKHKIMCSKEGIHFAEKPFFTCEMLKEGENELCIHIYNLEEWLLDLVKGIDSDRYKTNEKKTLEDLENEYGEMIPGNEIARYLNISNQQFIDIINNGDGPISSREEELRAHLFSGKKYPCFSELNLEPSSFCSYFMLMFNIKDIRKWMNEREEKEEKTNIIFVALEEEKKTNALLQSEIVRLEEESWHLKSMPQAPTPLSLPIGGQSKELEQDNARVAALEEENQGLKNEIERLKQQLAEWNTAQGVDETKTKFDVEPTGKNKGSYLAMIDALRSAVTIKDKDLASWLENKLAGLGYDSPKAQAIRIIMKDVEEHRKEKVLLPPKR